MSAPSAAPDGRTSIFCRSSSVAMVDSLQCHVHQPIGCCPSLELHADGFGDEGGAGGALDLDGVLRGDAHAAAVDGFDGLDLLVKPNTRAGGHLPGEAHPVGAVVEPSRAMLHAVKSLAEPRHER